MRQGMHGMVGWAIGGTRLGMGARGVEYAAGDAWYGGMGDRGDTVGDGVRGVEYAAGDAWYGGMGDRGTRLGMGRVAGNMRQGMHGM
jgi:hypothetical protein